MRSDESGCRSDVSSDYAHAPFDDEAQLVTRPFQQVTAEGRSYEGNKVILISG